ncbi:MAG: aldo/keto reductase [Bryobacteraceae bacterium]|nr:aldo/keto reductase [Bryobacteraceae bacterium]
MNYQLLGPSGLRVSQLCLGAMTFGEEWGWGSSAETAGTIYQSFRDAGGNFVDTADVYTNGNSERILGQLIAGHRHEVVLATKFTAAMGTDPNSAGNHRKKIMQSVEASLRRLATDYIDLYWVHSWDQITPAAETLRALDDLVSQGKINYIGSSDTPAWIVSESNAIADLRGWASFAAIQVEYNLLERTVERDLLPMAKHHGLAVLAWSPLANGLLTGKYHEGESPDPHSRLNTPGLPPDWTLHKERASRVAEVVVNVATQLGHRPAQIALAWLRQQGPNVIPILGARKPEQFAENLRSLDVVIPQNALDQLNQVSAVDLGFPQTFLSRDLLRSLVFAGHRDSIQTARFLF